MNRHVLLFVTSPALLVGIVLLGTCGISMWMISHLQRDQLRTFHNTAASFRAVDEMDEALCQLRYHGLVASTLPPGQRRQLLDADHKRFAAALERVRRLEMPEQAGLVQAIQKAYEEYHEEIKTSKPATAPRGSDESVPWVDEHPIQRVVDPCHALLEANEQQIEANLARSEVTGGKVLTALVLLGVSGSLGGLICGITIARRLSGTLSRLQVRVQDAHSQLTPEQQGPQPPRAADGNLAMLDNQLEVVVERVRGLMERMQVQQKLLSRAEQLAAIGQLAAGVTHEIRNPLTALRWLIDHAIASYGTEQPQLEDLRVMQAEITRMESTVKGLADFCRPTPPQRVTVDLRNLVRDVLDLVRMQPSSRNRRCEAQLPDSPVLATVDPTQIRSALVNLVLKALDGLPEGGRLCLILAADPQAGVRLVIDDVESGCRVDTTERVLPLGAGDKTNTVGLGAAQRVVEDHGGQLCAEQRPGRGPRFTVLLAK